MFSKLFGKNAYLFAYFFSITAFAQTAALEMAPGNGNPTGNGPTLSTVIRLRNNTNNATNGNTFSTFTPAVTATYTLTNFEFPQYYAATDLITRESVVMGYSILNASTGTPTAIFPRQNDVGSPAASNFTSAGSTAGNGISVTENNTVNLKILTAALKANDRSRTGRHRIADLEITFNRAVDNPILNFAGLGAATTSMGISAEFNINVTSSTALPTYTKVSGNTSLVLTGNQINNADTALSDSNANGSVKVNALGVTKITLSVFVRGDGTGSALDGWSDRSYPAGNNSVGDAFTISLSTPLPSSTANACTNGSSTNGLPTPTDSDGDGLNDICDLDDDNDGILDADELYCDQTITPNGAFPTGSPTTGAYAKQLLFFNWNGKTLANGTTQTVTHNGIDYTATISAVTTPLNMAPSRILTWPAGPTHMVGKYYQFADANFLPVFYNSEPVGSGNRNKTTSFNVTISAKKGTREYPVDVVVFDSEVSTSARNEKLIFDVTSNGSAFELLEKFGSDPLTNNITLSNSNKTLTYSNTEAAKVNAMYVTRGYSPTIKAASTSANDGNGGQQGIGFAVRLYCDNDNDGDPNYLDLDSDNDGCSDSNEYYNTNALTWDPANITVDSDGKVVGAAYSGGSYANAVVATNANIATQPIDKTINAGATTTFTVGATSFNTTTFAAGVPNYTSPPATSNATNIKYQWQVSTNGGTSWTNLTNVTPYSGVLTSTLTITAAPISLNNNRYRAVVTLTNNVCTLLPSNGAILKVNKVVCYDDPYTEVAGVATNHGITLLNRAGADNGNWPMNKLSAHTVLESNTKGFVITRMSSTEIAAIVSPQEAMMVYDTTIGCLKIYDGTAWSCFSTPACP